MRDGLKRNEITKTKKTLDMLGLQTWEQFQSFWNKKIEQWNTAYPDNPITENYEIDHIKPVSAFKQFVHGDMNHYTNLQPLLDNSTERQERELTGTSSTSIIGSITCI